jgi:hypothetical protein
MGLLKKNSEKLQKQYKFEKLANWLKTDTGKEFFEKNAKNPKIIAKAKENLKADLELLA